MPALDLLLKMQASRTHMALVIDEYGGTDGLVSIEDVVEADRRRHRGRARRGRDAGASCLPATARSSSRPALALDEVSEAVGFDFASLADAEEVDTIGGLVTASAGRVPGRGEILRGPGEFELKCWTPTRAASSG